MDKNIPTTEEELIQEIEKTNKALSETLSLLLSQNEKLRQKIQMMEEERLS